mgnify:FL=1
MKKLLFFFLLFIFVLCKIGVTANLDNSTIKIYLKEKEAEKYLITQKNLNLSEFNFCKDTLNEFYKLLKNKTYDELNNDEKEKLKQIYLLFIHTDICTARLLPKYLEFTDSLTKAPDNKLSILFSKVFFTSDSDYGEVKSKDPLPFILEEFPECNKKSDFKEKIQCLYGSNKAIRTFPSWFRSYSSAYFVKHGVGVRIYGVNVWQFSSLLLKNQYPDKITLLVFQPKRVLGLPKDPLKVKKQFEEELKDLSKKTFKPLCETYYDISLETGKDFVQRLEQIVAKANETEPQNFVYKQQAIISCPSFKLEKEIPWERVITFSKNSTSDREVSKVFYLKKFLSDEPFLGLSIFSRENFYDHNENDIRIVYNTLRSIILWYEKEFIPRNYL